MAVCMYIHLLTGIVGELHLTLRFRLHLLSCPAFMQIELQSLPPAQQYTSVKPNQCDGRANVQTTHGTPSLCWRRVFLQKLEWNIAVMCLSTKSQNTWDGLISRRCYSRLKVRFYTCLEKINPKNGVIPNWAVGSILFWHSSTAL